MDEEVLTYNGVVLKRSVSGPHYLNVCIIQFYFSYLTSQYDDRILLVSPTISFWLANSQKSDADFRDFEESNQLSKKQVVMFTVNDNEDTSQSDGGKHWSLLVYYRKSNTFVHYDSFGGFNSLVARKLYRAVKNCVAAPATQAPTPAGTSSLVTHISSKMGHKYYSKHLRRIINYPKKNMLVSFVIGYIFSKKYLRRFINYHSVKVCYALQKYIISNNGDDEETIDRDDDDDPWFREENVMPQQTNWYDCGLYMMAIARVICEWYYDEERAEQEQFCCFLKDDRFPNITKHLDNSLEYTMRSEMLRFIQHHIELKTNECIGMFCIHNKDQMVDSLSGMLFGTHFCMSDC